MSTVPYAESDAAPVRRRYVVGAVKIAPELRDVAHAVLTPEDDRGFFNVIGGEDDPSAGHSVPLGENVTYRVELTDEEADRFRRASNCRYVELDGVAEQVAPAASTMQWMRADFPTVADFHGRDVLVGMVDAGTTAAVRSYLGATMVARRVFDQPDPGAAEITNDHGCKVASALIPQGGRFLDAIASTPERVFAVSTAVAAARWCADQGAQIVNFSAATLEPHSSWNDMLQYLLVRGVQFFAGMGNDGLNQAAYPAALSTTFANCHSSIAFDERTGTRASFSNYTATASGCAPGVAVWGLSPSATPLTWNGTSASTPHMARLCAMGATGGRFTAAQVGAALKATTRNTGQPAEQQGRGAYSLEAALTSLGALSSPAAGRFPYAASFPDGVAYPTIPLGSATVNVSTSAQLTSALANASAGQRIVLASGTYSGAFSVTGKAGTSTSGISIEAATTGGAVFASGSTWTIKDSSFVTLRGLTFPYELSSGNLVQFRGTANRCRVTRCLFGPTSIGTPGANKAPFVYMGDSVEFIRVDHNEFRNKANPGNTILGDGNFSTLQAVRHIRIDHNLLRSIKPEVTNEKEPIRLGVSTMSKTASNSVIERNRFEDCICEPEIVSVKCDNVRVTGNTVWRSIGGIVYRHGRNGVVSDNYIVDRNRTFGSTIGSGGFRFYDSGHEVSFNYVDGIYGGNFQQALMLDTGDAEGSSTNLSAHWRVVNAKVLSNVVVDCPEGITVGDNYSSAPTGCQIDQNVIVRTASGTAITQKIAPVSTTIGTNPYFSTPAAASMTQASDTIWRRAGVGPRLTFLQAGDVGVSGDPNDSDGTGVLVSGGGGGTSTPPPPAGDTSTAAGRFGWGTPLDVSDEFGYSGSPSSTKWSLYNGPGHSNNGRRLPARVTVDGAKLVGTGLANGDSFGMAHRFNQQYGRWEVRMRAYQNATSNGNDYHPVLIIWPQSDEWPEDGEYDFVELSVPGQQTLGAFMHFPHDPGEVQQRQFTRAGVDTSVFHNYAIEWTPDALVGYVDGVEWFRTSGGARTSPAPARRDIQAMPSGHLTIQLDNFDGTSQTPATMEVEWVRVYTLTPSGPVAGPQTVTATGIGSSEAVGRPTVSVAGLPAPPPTGSTPTLLGSAVLGASGLGWTAPGAGVPLPAAQTVRAAGIPSVQALGSPVVSVADGPQTVVAVGIEPPTLLGRPSVSVQEAPAPAPGRVLVPALFAVAADGVTLTPLPAWTKISLSPQRNSQGSLTVEYPAGAPGFSTIHDGVSAYPLRALEVRVWLGGNATGALGGWLVQKSGDDLTPGSGWSFSGHFHEWLLGKALVAPQTGATSQALEFVGATAGLIYRTVLEQAQARGALPLVTRDFTDTHDSNGQPWAKTVSDISFAPKTTVAQVADKCVELDMAEYELTAARVWRAFNPGTRGMDRTLGASPLMFKHAVNLREHSRRESSKDGGTTVLAAGSEGWYEWADSATARAELGWRAEVAVDAGQVSSQAGVQAVAATQLEILRNGTAEYTSAVEFAPGEPLPLIDYGIGDWAYTWVGAKRRRLRIAQIGLEFSVGQPPKGTVAQNDLITDKVAALYRRLNSISSGDAVVGTSNPTPGGLGEDANPPAAPAGVTVGSVDAYQQPGESETYALVVAGWAAVTRNAYPDDATAARAKAATLIAGRLRSGQAIGADWTWAGAPGQVVAHAASLLAEWQAASSGGGASDAAAWLEGYVTAAATGGAVTNDVARYRVQYRYIGSAVVPSRQDPGNGVPGEPVPPRDPGAFPDDAGWFEPAESPTVATRLEFGGVLGGRAISVRVSAVDLVGNQGPWCTPVGVVTALDNRPPPAPSRPIAAAWFETANVTWDGRGSAGEDMFAAAPDIASGGRVELHMGLGIDFIPDRPTGPDGRTVDLAASSTYRTDFQWPRTANVADLSIGTTYFFRFVAVDRTGNASEPSETSDGVLPRQLVNIQIGPDAIGRAQIIDGEIVNAKIANGAVNDLKVSNVSVGKLTAGTMSANVVIGGRFETPLTNGNQIQLDAAGLRLYRGGTVIGRWQVFDSSMLMTGQFNSAVTGQRVVVNPGGSNPDTIRFYPTFSDVYSSIDAVDFGGGTVAGIRIVGSGTTATANRGMVVVRDQYASLVHGRTDLSYWGSEIWVEQNFTRNKSATVDLIVDERLTPLSGPRRVAMITYNAAGQPRNQTGLYYGTTTAFGGEPMLYANGQDVNLVFGGTDGVTSSRLLVRNNGNTQWRPIAASSFDQQSGRESKYGIRDFTADPLRKLRQTRPKFYRRHGDLDSDNERLGFIAEEMPDEVRRPLRRVPTGGGPVEVIETIDLGAIAALLWAAQLRNDERLTALETSQNPAPRRRQTKEPAGE